MEAVLRAKGLFHVVVPKDTRALKKLAFLEQIADKDAAKLAQIELDKLRHEDQVIAILRATIEPALLNSIRVTYQSTYPGSALGKGEQRGTLTATHATPT